MPWFAVDDGFPEHPKLEELESDPTRYMAAVTVWCIMGADCMRRLTDGHVSSHRLEKVLGFLGKHARNGVSALVDKGLWTIESDGWRYHDWAEYQPTKADIQKAKKQKTDRQKRWRENEKTRKVDGLVDDLVDAPVDASTDPSRGALRDAVPSPPLPSPPLPVSESASALDRFEKARSFVRRQFAARFETAKGSMWTRATSPDVDTLTHWLLSLAGEPSANLAKTLDTFFADPWVQSQHFPVGHLAKYPDKYREPRQAPPAAPANVPVAMPVDARTGRPEKGVNETSKAFEVRYKAWEAERNARRAG